MIETRVPAGMAPTGTRRGWRAHPLGPPPHEPVGLLFGLDLDLPVRLFQPALAALLGGQRLPDLLGHASTSTSRLTPMAAPLTTRWLLWSFDNRKVVERIAACPRSDGRRAERARRALVRHLLASAQRAHRLHRHARRRSDREPGGRPAAAPRERGPREGRLAATSTRPAGSSTRASRSTTRCSSSSRKCRRSASESR